MEAETFSSAVDEGRKLAWVRDWEGAAASFRRACSESPRDLLAWNYLAFSLSKLERWSDAADAYATVLALNDGDAVALGRLAEAQERLGRWAEASGSYARLTSLCHAMGDVDKAGAVWDRAFALARSGGLQLDGLYDLASDLGLEDRLKAESVGASTTEGPADEAEEPAEELVTINLEDWTADTSGLPVVLAREVEEGVEFAGTQLSLGHLDAAEDEVLRLKVLAPDLLDLDILLVRLLEYSGRPDIGAEISRYLAEVQRLRGNVTDADKVEEEMARLQGLAETGAAKPAFGGGCGATPPRVRRSPVVPSSAPINQVKMATAVMEREAVDLEVKSLVTRGKELLEAGQSDEATRVLGDALRGFSELSSESAEVRASEVECRLLLARAYEQKGDWRKAAVALYDACNLIPDDEQACLGLAEANFMLGETPIAVRELWSVLNSLENRQQYDRAAAVALTLLDADSLDAQARTRLENYCKVMGVSLEGL